MKTSIYNEQHYLFDSDTKKQFEELGMHHLDKAQLEKELYSDALEDYDLFIQKTAELLHHLGYSSALECSLMISYLIHNGFLSNDCFIINRSPDAKREITHRLGTSVIKSEGCCRNYTNMLKDIFRVLELPTDNYYCYQGNMKKALDNPANHTISLVSHEGNIYGIDIYNSNHLFKFDSGFILKEISPRSSIRLFYKPYYEIVLGENDFTGVKQRIKRFDDYSKNYTLNPTEYRKEIKRPTEEKMEEHYSDLCDFHEQNKSLKKQICREIRSHQK